MTVPTFHPSMLNIRSEFGGTAATPLSAYVRGGAFVPIQTVLPIPTAVPIGVLAFAGAQMPPSISYTGATPSNSFTVSSAVVASDLSTMTFVVARTKIDGGGPSKFDFSPLNFNFAVSGGLTSPRVVLRSRAVTQDAGGYWKLVTVDDVKVIASPGQLTPTRQYTTYDNHFAIADATQPYLGRLEFASQFPIVAQPTPPTRELALVGTAFSLQMALSWTLDRGIASPPGSSMSWNTRNVSNTYIELPIALDVYDGSVLVATYNSVLHFEINSTYTFNPS